jgi:hypothetical protein
MNPLTQSKNATILPLLITLTFGCFGLSPQARAVCKEDCIPNQSTALGEDALFSLTTGSSNTAVGHDALFFNTTGRGNTALGSLALLDNNGDENTAIGTETLLMNTTGNANTAIGHEALFFNSTGSNNTALGFQALFSNTTGGNNTANGNRALYLNTTGGNNTANGWRALYMNTTATNNTAHGHLALNGNTIGPDNTALGYSALSNNTTGSSNIAIGSSAGINLTTGNNNIDIGALGVGGEANTIRIGETGLQTNVYIAGISGATVAGGVTVRIDATGHLGTLASSARYKEAIQPMTRESEPILSLKPVTFRYKKELDPHAIPQFGLVAEDVAKIDPDLVAKDDQGKPYTVRYEAVNAMLLNEFLKEHKKVEEQAALLKRQEERLDRLEALITGSDRSRQTQ